MAHEEKAKAWAVQHKICDEAVLELFEEGFNSLEAIKLLEPDDLSETKISPGQKKLIIASVQKLNQGNITGQTEGTVPHSSAHLSVQLSSAQMQGEHQAAQFRLAGENPHFQGLGQLLQSTQETVPIGQSVDYAELLNLRNYVQLQTGYQGNNSVRVTWSGRDPQIYLSRAALGKSPHSHYDITDYVTVNVEEEIIVGGNESQQVVLKSGPTKPKLENVALAQWCMANNAILDKLICESKLNSNNILDYISYSTGFETNSSK